MGSALLADTARHICSVGPVLEVVSTGRYQGNIEGCRPFLVGLREPPDMVGGQAKVTEYRPERLAAVDRATSPLLNIEDETVC